MCCTNECKHCRAAWTATNLLVALAMTLDSSPLLTDQQALPELEGPEPGPLFASKKHLFVLASRPARAMPRLALAPRKMQSERGEGHHAYTSSALARLRFRSARGGYDRNRRCCTARVEHLKPDSPGCQPWWQHQRPQEKLAPVKVTCPQAATRIGPRIAPSLSWTA